MDSDEPEPPLAVSLMCLPTELVLSILEYIAASYPTSALARASRVNKLFNRALKPHLYRSVDILQTDPYYEFDTKLHNTLLKVLLDRRSDAIEYVKDVRFKGVWACHNEQYQSFYSAGIAPNDDYQREMIVDAFELLMQNIAPNSLESVNMDVTGIALPELLHMLLEKQKNLQSLMWNLRRNMTIIWEQQFKLGKIASSKLPNLTNLKLISYPNSQYKELPIVRALLAACPNLRSFSADIDTRIENWWSMDLGIAIDDVLLNPKFEGDIPFPAEDVNLVEPVGYNVLHSLATWVPNQLTELRLKSFSFDLAFPRSPSIDATVGCLDLKNLKVLELIQCSGAIHVLKRLTGPTSLPLKVFSFHLFHTQNNPTSIYDAFGRFVANIAPGLEQLSVLYTLKEGYQPPNSSPLNRVERSRTPTTFTASGQSASSGSTKNSESPYFALPFIEQHASTLRGLVLHSKVAALSGDKQALDLDQILPRSYLADFFSSFTQLEELGITISHSYFDQHKPVSYESYKRREATSRNELPYSWLSTASKLKYLHVRNVRFSNMNNLKNMNKAASYDFAKMTVASDAKFLGTVLSLVNNGTTLTTTSAISISSEKYIIFFDRNSTMMSFTHASSSSTMDKKESHMLARNMYPSLYRASSRNRRIPADVTKVLPVKEYCRGDVYLTREEDDDEDDLSLQRGRVVRDHSQPGKWGDVNCEILHAGF